ncbi:MAG: flagellar basal body P-ring protein FlgI [Planctomycetes bacterium]|nr:flagellar basal body P-ring protein FlgI [Planctomycetota bacterium]
MRTRLTVILMILLSVAGICNGQRIKDIVDIQGVRGNPLTGVGLVIGLSDTGDSTLPSQQMLTNILRDSGLVFSPTDLSGGNIAIVMVTAELGPFAREGSGIDVLVSSIGDAKSLLGGILLPTPLKGLDGQVYAISQGPISIAGWSVSGDKASMSKNHQTVARIPNGAIVERAEIARFVESVSGHRYITLNLRNVDFSTAEQIGISVNRFYPDSSLVVDAGTIRVQIPDSIDDGGIARFIDEITQPEVKVDVPAVVIVNERTGTIVVGEKVGISSVAISQGSLIIKIKEQDLVSQPTAMFSDAGSTQVTQDTMLEVSESDGVLIPVLKTVTVSDLAKALNAIGATPTDIIAIFSALKKAGALQAKLEIM